MILINTSIDIILSISLARKCHSIIAIAYSVTFDGTPAFAEAEAVIIRVVTMNFEILELLVKCNLFKQKLKGVELANHIVSTITERCAKDLKDWSCAQQDRASTNKNALKQIESEFANVKISKNYCCSHSLSNSGKEMMGPKGSAKYAEHFRKLFQSIIHYPGKAREQASRVFGEQVLEAGGVRFCVKYEQICQIADQGVDKILEDVLPICKENKWSELSTQKIIEEFSTIEKSSDLGMAMVEIAAVADHGKIFAESCYTLEGDSDIILRGSAVFDRLEESIEGECHFTRVQFVVDKALDLILTGKRIVTETRDLDRIMLYGANVSVNNVKDVLNHLKITKQNILGGTTKRGIVGVNTARATNTGALVAVTNEIVESQIQLNVLMQELEVAKEKMDKSDDKLNQWDEKYRCTTRDELLDYSKSVGAPVIDYYNKLFNNTGGDCYNIRQMVKAAKIFNPLYLTGHSDADIITILYPLADKLIHFGCIIFTEGFITQFKKEIPNVVKVADEDHNLDNINSSKQCGNRMQKRIKKKRKEPNTELDWKEEDGEYACRIWEWWRTRVKDFPCFALALRLVVLTQLSSCSVERVFSRLKLIENLCGGGMLEDHLEMRLFIQCNGDLNELVKH